MLPSPTPLRELSTSQRAVLVHNAAGDARGAVRDFTHLDVDFLNRLRPDPRSVLASGLSISALRAAGLATTEALRDELGVTAVHLSCELEFATQLVRHFGASAVQRAFLCTPTDALALSSSAEVVVLLGLSTEALLRACRAHPSEALGVLRFRHGIDASVTHETLRHTTLTADALRSAGVTALALMQYCGLDAKQLESYGFSLLGL